MGSMSETFRLAYQSVISEPASRTSDPKFLRRLLGTISTELNTFWFQYRSFIRLKYKFAQKYTDRATADFTELQRQFFNTKFRHRLLDEEELSQHDLDRIYWCTCIADYILLQRLLTIVETLPDIKVVFATQRIQDLDMKTQYARYHYAVDLFRTMQDIAEDLEAYVWRQREPDDYMGPKRRVFELPMIAEELLLTSFPYESPVIHGSVRNHLAAVILIRSHLEAIAYRRDIVSEFACVAEEDTEGLQGEIYSKIRKLKGKIGDENATYLCKTYQSLSEVVHNGWDLSFGEAWIFLETVRTVYSRMGLALSKETGV